MREVDPLALIAQCAAAGYTVFMEIDAEDAWVGLHRNPGLGIEGVIFCDHRARRTTIDAALLAVMALVGLAPEEAK